MDELIDIIDEDGNVIGSKLKSRVHTDGDWHRSAHVWITNGTKIMLQKRAMSKEFFPGCFDVSCAGHVKSGEDYADAAVRELKEELDVGIDKKELLYLGERKQVSIIKEKNLISREIMMIFLLNISSPEQIRPNEDEISETRFFDIDELRKLILRKPELFVDDTNYFFDTITKIENLHF